MKIPQTAIPYLFMRGGTSRGPYFRRENLPKDLATLSKVLIAVTGSGHRLNIDGLGGGDAVTTKVAMISQSKDAWADVDYFFAQVAVEEQLVDYKPTCGNILAGVGPAAIEMGLVAPVQGVSEVKIHALNTNARVVARVQSDQGNVVYDGDTTIAGVPGTAAPIELSFLDVVGSVTGSLLPTGRKQDTIDGINVTCMDVAMPVVIARAADFGLSGHESAAELDNNRDFFARIESIRLQAGHRMGMGDVRKSVTPKFAIVSAARAGGSISARYFMPWKTHPSMAVTGAQCIASCALTPDTVAYGLGVEAGSSPIKMSLEHPSGKIDVLIDFAHEKDFTLRSAGLTRTARKLAEGYVYIPGSIWRQDQGS